jgi:hypothetical protein
VSKVSELNPCYGFGNRRRKRKRRKGISYGSRKARRLGSQKKKLRAESRTHPHGHFSLEDPITTGPREAQQLVARAFAEKKAWWRVDTGCDIAGCYIQFPKTAC